MHELEQMMQGLEAGKKLVIQFPEAINRDDYDDVLAREDHKKDDVVALETPKPKRITSRIKRNKIDAPQAQKKAPMFEVPVYMELSSLSKNQQNELKDLLQKKPTVTLTQPMIIGNKVLAMAEFHCENKVIISTKKRMAEERAVGCSDSVEYRDMLIKQVKDSVVKQRKQGKPP